MIYLQQQLWKHKLGEVTLTNDIDIFTTAIKETQIRGSNSYK